MVKRPKQVKPEAAMTLTAVYWPSMVAIIYSGLPTRDRVAVPMLTSLRVRTVLETTPVYSRFHSSAGTAEILLLV